MVGYGFMAPANDVIQGAAKNGLQEQLKIGSNASAAQMLPGRLVSRDNGDYDVKEGSALLSPVGWLGYEGTNFKPATIDTAYAVADDAMVYNGGGFRVRASLAKGCSVVKGNLLANWTNGQVIGPIEIMAGGLALGIPFGAGDSTNPNDTSIDLPGNILVRDIVIEVETLSSGETMDVGFDNADESGDLDGLADGVSLTTAVKVIPDATITGTTDMYYDACTRGAYLRDFDAGAGTGDQGIYHPKPYLTDGEIKSVNYVKATANVGTGKIWLVLESEGLQIVACAAKTADATSGAVNVWSGSLI
jgi:hypothetical protein